MDKILLLDFTPISDFNTPTYLKPLLEKYSLSAGWMRPNQHTDKFRLFISATMDYSPNTTPNTSATTNKTFPFFSFLGYYDEYWEVEKEYSTIIADLVDLANLKENEEIASIEILLPEDEH